MLEMIREGDSWKIDKFKYAGKALPPEPAVEKK
jgi:hypothetical protein